MAISTPGSRIHKWCSTLRQAYLLQFNKERITSHESLLQAITTARDTGLIKADCLFATDHAYGIHPHHGVPQLYFDQLNIIGQHLQGTSQHETVMDNVALQSLVHKSVVPPASTTTLQSDIDQSLYNLDTGIAEPPPTPSEPVHAQKLTWCQILKLPTLPEWRASQYKQLDEYKEQGMFSEPLPKPTNANALHMLWTYIIKACGTLKSRMVANAQAKYKGTITLGYVYANAERLFWAIVAQEGMTAIGCDVSNAFAEAPPPKAPLYLYIDAAYKEWWTEHLGLDPIPPECNVVQVKFAIQGHPEAARLWEKHIDAILRSYKLQPT